MISQKIRNNASISYFFLGWLFLLAKNNPNFSDSFIRQHAKIATKGHILFFVMYIFYSHFLSKINIFSYSIPVIQITIDHVIDISFFTFLTIFIIQGVYRGQRSDSVSKNTLDYPDMFSLQGNIFQFNEASEGERVILFLSHIPFLGMLVAKKYPNTITTTGVRMASIFGLLYLIAFTSRGFDSLSMILLFIGIVLIIFLATRFFIYDNYLVYSYIEKIPGIESIYRVVRTIPVYLGDLGNMIFGKKINVSFMERLTETQEKDQNFKTPLQTYFIDESLPFQSFWIFIPFVNLVFLPKLFISRTTRYVLAIGQGLVMTLLAILLGLLFSFTSPIELFLLFPIFYGISTLETNVFTRIPVIYEIYALLNTITFGLLKNTKRVQSIQKQDTQVSFKMQ
ncbi:MAG: hypothetical protein WC774_01435 [Candidatus Gracilibacteria bacterium]